MKKLLILLVTLLSCDNTDPVEIYYYQDITTGICFSAQGSGSNHHPYENTMTCVPCDSLSRVKVILFNSSHIHLAYPKR